METVLDIDTPGFTLEIQESLQDAKTMQNCANHGSNIDYPDSGTMKLDHGIGVENFGIRVVKRSIWVINGRKNHRWAPEWKGT